MSNAGVTFERVSPNEWLDRVRQSLEQNGEDPSGQMLSLWESAVSPVSPFPKWNPSGTFVYIIQSDNQQTAEA